MPQNISKGDLEIILSGAAALHARDASGKAFMELKGIAEVGTGTNGVIPIEAVYEVADLLRIPREYVDSYQKSRFPSVEQKVRTIGKLDLKPNRDSFNGIRQIVFTDYETELLGELRNRFPLESFVVERKFDFDFPGKIFCLKLPRKSFNLDRKKRLAQLNIDASNSGLNITLDVLDPLFGEVCSDKLLELKERYSKVVGYYSAQYSYPVLQAL
jgi:hypothetical protein